ncbi:MAG: hypothetical protein K9J12_10655 [Melioribacteraceae bacterium]|nr:hypothetical protein [Melioribacteraceae bacterium]MCF8414148.1 hypothetical protein [Melioribacteraceae bacterium]
MRSREQKKYLDTLKKYERKMDSKEYQKYKMLVKRNKDEEELDKLSLEFLKSLFDKYYTNRERKSFDHFFKQNESSNSE